MSTHVPITGTLSRRIRATPQRRDDALEFRLLFAVVIPVFLAIEVLSRLFPRSRAAAIPATKPGSVWEEAKAAAHRAVPLAFMG